MDRSLKEHVTQRVGFDEWLAEVEKRLATKGINLFPDGTPERVALNEAQHELARISALGPNSQRAQLAEASWHDQQRDEIARLRADLSDKFEQYRGLKERETELKSMLAARLNPIGRWLHNRTTAKLERVKLAMNENRAKVEKLRAAKPTMMTKLKHAKLGKEMQALRRQSGRLQGKIQARMTPYERHAAGQIREQKQRLLGMINTERGRLQELRQAVRTREQSAPAMSLPQQRARGMALERLRERDTYMDRGR